MATESPSDPPGLRALRRLSSWTVVDDLTIDRAVLDHVVIAPSAVLAVRNAAHGSGWRDRLRVGSAARALAAFLDACDVHATVTPVLMRSGARAPHPVEGFRVEHGVHVVDGDHPYLWRHRFAAPVISADARLRIGSALASLAARPAPPRPVPRSVTAG